MAKVVVIGERELVPRWALAGAVVYDADDAEQVRRAWNGLDSDVAVVVLTPAAAECLTVETNGNGPLTVVLPP